MNSTPSTSAAIPALQEAEAPKSDKQTKKKTSWSYEETIALINVMATEATQKKLEGMVHNHKVWQDIAASLDGRHTAEKCHDKWTYLKRRYREVTKNNNSSGRGRQSFMYYEEMDNVLGS
jgi:hypothetical protein